MKPCIVVITAYLFGLVFAGCSDGAAQHADCDDGKCDDVPASPCDGKLRDLSGAGNARVAGTLNDAFAKHVLRAGDSCPVTFAEMMEKLSRADLGTAPSASCIGERHAVRTNVISETAQLLGKPTSYRVVTTRACEDTSDIATDGVVFSLLGVTADPGSLPDDVEIMAFDKTAGVFNYYASEQGVLSFFGNSKDLMAGSEDDIRRCANCHPNGGLVMKELDAPWIHWEDFNTLPGARQLVEAHKGMLGEISGASDLESMVRNGNEHWNESRLSHLKSSATARVKDLLRPLFCSDEINLDAMRTPRVIPFNAFLDRRLANPEAPSLPPSDQGFTVDPADYDALIRAAGQTVAGMPGIIDTAAAYVFVEPSHADINFVEQLESAGLLDRDFIADVLMIDFTRPVFSDERCDLLAFAPDLPNDDLTLKAIRTGFITNLKRSTPASGSAAAALLKHLQNQDDLAAHQTKMAAFAAACETLGSKPFLQNALAIVSVNRDKARKLPVIEFPETMPDDAQVISENVRLHPETCQLVDHFVSP
jgi:hypothetical protein